MRWPRRPWTQACGCSAAGWPRTWIPSWWPVTDDHRWHLPADQGVQRRVHGHRRDLSGGSLGVGREDRGRLPVCSRDPRVHARPSGGQLSEARIAPSCPKLPTDDRLGERTVARERVGDKDNSVVAGATPGAVHDSVTASQAAASLDVEWVTSPEIVEYPRRARWILDLQEVFGVGENGALGIREPVQQ